MTSPQGWFEIVHHVDRDRNVHGADIKFGLGRVNEIASIVDDRGLKRALVVCGRHVGANQPLMDAIRDALGSRLVGVFDGSSPGKELATIYDGIDSMRELEADVVIGVGGGSSLDTARQMSVYASDGRPMEEFRQDAYDGRLTAPTAGPDATAVLLLPTTFAGADLASGGSIEVLAPSESPNGQPIRTFGTVTPLAIVYDPTLYATTPVGPLRNSAMNGFDKGIETIYAPTATPVADALSVRGLQLLVKGLPHLGTGDVELVGKAVAGVVLVQLRRITGIIHAFGHGIARHSDIQQGLGHAVMAPHVLRFVFSRVDARRALLAAALGVDTSSRTDDEVAEAIVDVVTDVRDSLEVPARWSDVPGGDELHFDAIGEHITADRLMKNSPVPITAEEASEVLAAAR